MVAKSRCKARASTILQVKLVSSTEHVAYLLMQTLQEQPAMCIGTTALLCQPCLGCVLNQHPANIATQHFLSSYLLLQQLLHMVLQ